ncbi:MAG: NCS1 family nucleobase:cation symporter-1 [Gemmataceae bacterium]|nr:NCS1 family nucleobase:cation symporter-1 [Gemmataceae bacterium]
MSGIVELQEDVSASPYFNHDMAPVPARDRKWGLGDMAALWISMSACVPTYMLASSLIQGGMDWKQAVLTVFVGNLIVLMPMIANAHAGTKYGIPFPVYCRPSFGILGANIPALLRAFVACGWFGIQTWIGGAALHTILIAWFPQFQNESKLPWLNIDTSQFTCFLIFWLINVIVVVCGIESIRHLLNIKAPLLITLGLVFVGWAYWRADGFGPMFSQPSEFAAGGKKAGQFWTFFVPALTANVGFWATLSLNIPDFSRFARSQRDQALGQAIGLPTTMGLFAFIGVAVTSATVVIFGEAIWDPVVVLNKFQNRWVVTGAMAALALATLATNIAANVVSPANDFAHLWPRVIGFRTGGIVTALIGILIRPWELVADPSGYIFTWLVGYSSLLGAIGGILIVDYYLIRRTSLDLAGLYRREGPYWYTSGINLIAVVALVAGIAPCVPGFLATVKLASFGEPWLTIYSYAWFVSFAVAGVVYGAGAKATQ